MLWVLDTMLGGASLSAESFTLDFKDRSRDICSLVTVQE